MASDRHTADPSRVRLARAISVAWAALAVAIVVAASLAPVRPDLSPAHLEAQWAHWRASFAPLPLSWHNQRDLVTNALLYLPLGLLVPWLLADGDGRKRRLARGATLAAGPLLSLAMELAQAATGNRYPSAWDWAGNSAGYVAGWLVGGWIIARYRLSAAVFLGDRGGVGRAVWAAALRAAYVPFFVLCGLLPLDFDVGLDHVWAKLAGAGTEQARVFLNPLEPWSWPRARALTLVAALLVPFGFLSALARPEPRRRTVERAAVAGGLLAALVAACQLAVASRSSDVLVLLAGALGAGMGVALARAWDRSLADTAASFAETPRSNPALLATGLAYALFLWLHGWWPLQFLPDPRAAAGKLIHETNWIPFRDYAFERSVTFFADFTRETLWWLPLGWLIGAWLRGALRRGRLGQAILTVGLVGLFGAFVEFGQCLVVGRTVDVTDVFSHALGGLAGWLLAGLFMKEHGRAGGD